MHPAHRGFTLIEISIVLVIIGLIVGGVLVGADMILQAQLRKTVHQLEEYKAATNTFRLKYNCLPGDCTDAFTFFGTACDAAPNNCNGNNDGRIIDNYLTPTDNEGLRYWQHLGLAGLMSPQLTGTGNPNGIGVNVPSVPLRKGGMVITHGSNFAVNPGLIPVSGTTRHIFTVGSALSLHTNGALFKPQEALSIDTKFDDGKPDSRLIFTYQNAYANWVNNNMPNCKSGVEPNATYLTSYASPTCHLVFAW